MASGFTMMSGTPVARQSSAIGRWVSFGDPLSDDAAVLDDQSLGGRLRADHHTAVERAPERPRRERVAVDELPALSSMSSRVAIALTASPAGCSVSSSRMPSVQHATHVRTLRVRRAKLSKRNGRFGKRHPKIELHSE